MFKFATMSLVVCTALGIGLSVQLARADDKTPAGAKPTAEHAFFKNFVGEWDCDMESFLEPNKPIKHKSTMSGKMVGDFWAIADIKGDMMGMPFHGHGTFGYDPAKKKAVGTWIDSMTDFIWIYDGKIEGEKVIYDTKGPSPMDPNKVVAYRDTWDFSTPDKLVLTSEVAGPDGKLAPMMKATATRKK